MKLNKYSLNEMVKGWFIGDFNPSLFKTKDVEVAVKRYLKDDYENTHFHKIATEFTVIIEGAVLMNGVKYEKNDILVIEPGYKTDFLALEDTVTAVVKIPGATDDKYGVESW